MFREGRELLGRDPGRGRYARRMTTVRELLAGLQHLPRDAEVLAMEAGWLLMLLFRVNRWGLGPFGRIS
jgi:hypothetical protein